MTTPEDATLRRRRAVAGAEAARQSATAELELECPPTGLPVGEGLRRIRRRNRLIDNLVSVLIVVAPMALVVLAVLTYSVNERADKAVAQSAAARDAATEARRAARASEASLAELQATNDRLEGLVDAFAGLVVADTPEARAAARAELDRLASAPTPTTTRRSSTSPGSTSTSTTTTTTPASTTTSTSTTTTAPPTTSTTSPGLIPAPCSVVALPTCTPRRSP